MIKTSRLSPTTTTTATSGVKPTRCASRWPSFESSSRRFKNISSARRARRCRRCGTRSKRSDPVIPNRRKSYAARTPLPATSSTPRSSRCPYPSPRARCTACGSDAFKTVGNGTPLVVYDYVAPHFRRRIYRRETVACRCGSSIVTAPCPEKVFDRSQYTPGFVAYLIVAQCADAIPLYRLEKQFARVGVPVARSTMTDLFHRAAELLAPLSEPSI